MCERRILGLGSLLSRLQAHQQAASKPDNPRASGTSLYLFCIGSGFYNVACQAKYAERCSVIAVQSAAVILAK